MAGWLDGRTDRSVGSAGWMRTSCSSPTARVFWRCLVPFVLCCCASIHLVSVPPRVSVFVGGIARKRKRMETERKKILVPVWVTWSAFCFAFLRAVVWRAALPAQSPLLVGRRRKPKVPRLCALGLSACSSSTDATAVGFHWCSFPKRNCRITTVCRLTDKPTTMMAFHEHQRQHQQHPHQRHQPWWVLQRNGLSFRSFVRSHYAPEPVNNEYDHNYG